MRRAIAYLTLTVFCWEAHEALYCTNDPTRIPPAYLGEAWITDLGVGLSDYERFTRDDAPGVDVGSWPEVPTVAPSKKAPVSPEVKPERRRKRHRSDRHQ